jgi:hypothetical protein
MSIYRYIQRNQDVIYQIIAQTHHWRNQHIDSHTSASRIAFQHELCNAYSDLLLSATILALEVVNSGIALGEGSYAEFIYRVRRNFETNDLLAIHSMLQIVDAPTVDIDYFFLKAKFISISAEETDTQVECPICYTEISNRDALVVGCQHKFCKTCLFRWIDRRSMHKACTCPVCRYEISEVYTASEQHMRFMTERFESEQGAFATRVLASMIHQPGHNIS